MEHAFQYPPELMSLLIEAIPALFRSKADVLLFFRGAGVPAEHLADIEIELRRNRDAVKKHNIARTVLARVNAQGDLGIRPRREILRRVTQFEDYSSCWPEEIHRAKGLVADICRVVNVKDSFTRIQQEREAERDKNKDAERLRLEALRKRSAERERLTQDFNNLVAVSDVRKRGVMLEAAANRLFSFYGIGVRESFTRRDEGGTALEQVDGVVEIDGIIYLVEFKWWAEKVDVEPLSRHLVRLYQRPQARGVVISASGFTSSAITTCRESLQQLVFVLCGLDELFDVINNDRDIRVWLKKKVEAATLDKKPYVRPFLGDAT